MKQWHILVANGVNLDLLGSREPGIYGSTTLVEMEKSLRQLCKPVATMLRSSPIALHCQQSNDEATFLESLTNRESFGPYDGALINAGAWTHTSLALRDRLVAINLPFVEVHLSNVDRREEFRKHSYLSSIAIGQVSGFGMGSYDAALVAMVRHLENASIQS